MSIIVQNTWIEEDDQELHDYLSKEYSGYQILSEKDIIAIEPSTIDAIFAETAVVEQLLNKLPKYTHISSYPSEFNNFYKRDIREISVGDIYQIPKPFFIKPVTNKLFTGLVIDENYNLSFFKQGYELTDETRLYISDCVDFVNEFRLFIGGGDIIAIQESSDFILDAEKIIRSVPPKEFIEQILNANTNDWCVIDIGMIGNGDWAIVEVNPPFALSSYNLAIEKYFQYCRAAWMHTLIKSFS